MHLGSAVYVKLRQTYKMSEILPEQDYLFPNFTRKCVNHVNIRNATKQSNLSVRENLINLGKALVTLSRLGRLTQPG